MTIKSRDCKSSLATMKRFVTIVLRGLVSLSKESPMWAKEHHRPPKKEMKRKRRAVRRSKSMGRRNLVRAVGISPVVSDKDHGRFCCLRSHYLDHLIFSHSASGGVQYILKCLSFLEGGISLQ